MVASLGRHAIAAAHPAGYADRTLAHLFEIRDSQGTELLIHERGCGTAPQGQCPGPDSPWRRAA
ncbi:hypothetical protein CBM2637_B50022 [Cupriavidus taiwanensis]|nr:hypothetical protein CBM2637_B50022 [Cupriavidus taiwanensis]SPA54639.1 protein of unknown function [Cupriavidus taiwanensis]